MAIPSSLPTLPAAAKRLYSVLAATATCTGQAVIFSSSKIKTGSYKVKIGSTETNVTVSSKITTSGISSGGGPGGGGGFPGGGGGPGGR